MHVMLVEDDRAIAVALLDGLPRYGFTVELVTSGAEALARHGDADIVLLDLGLPDRDGIDVCREIRATSDVPIVIITARSDEVERVVGLEIGADDYVPKPFGLREVVARMRAVLRRTGTRRDRADAEVAATGSGSGGPPLPASSAANPAGHADDEDAYVVGGVRVEPLTRRVFAGGEEVALTPKEFDLLATLAEQPGVVLTRDELISRVWDAHWFGSTRTLDVHVGTLRRKLAGHVDLQTVRGVGFRLEAA